MNEIKKHVGGNNYILIGHNQRGLVSRYAAQQLQGLTPNPVSGVVTVNTPHRGTIQPGGASGSIQVTTQAGCPWSAVSGASWLTITSGATGTGSGTFTWTVSANTGISDRSASISVMGQAVQFLDGTSAGAPGHGTVTISGSPQSVSWNPCASYGQNCTQTLPEAGVITVTVGGVTVQAPYNSSASVMASLLAGQINNATPIVSATASGSTVTIISTLNGAATNYPLSTSTSFYPVCSGSQGQPCFTTPAFTSTTSGPTLTGGAD